MKRYIFLSLCYSLFVIVSCTYQTTSHIRHDTEWNEYSDRCLYMQQNTITAYQESKILSKFYIFTCNIIKFTLKQATKAQRGSRGIALLFLKPRRQMDGGGQRHAPAALPPGKARYPLYRRWVGPRTGMYGCGESRLTGIRSPDSPFWNKSLYRLSYPGPPCFKINLKIIGCTHNIVTDCVCMYVCMYVCTTRQIKFKCKIYIHKYYECNFRLSPCIITVNHFYQPTKCT